MATDQTIIQVPRNHLCPHCARALAERPAVAPGEFLIPLTGRRAGRTGIIVGWARVADDDLTREVLTAVSWHMQPLNRLGCGGYAYRSGPRSDTGQRPTVYLHVLVASHYFGPIPPGCVVDHIDRDKLNCTPGNLRITTQQKNCLNRGPLKSNTSGYVNVFLHTERRPGRTRKSYWTAQVRIAPGKRLRRSFPTAVEAAAFVNQIYRERWPDVPVPNPHVSG